MHATKHVLALLAVITAVLLGGCAADYAYTPEGAVTKAVARPMMVEFKTDLNSVQVLQKQQLGNKFMVLVSFNGTRATSGAESCLFNYVVIRSPLGGWETSGAGGGCSGQRIDPETQPITVSSGGGSSGPGDLGYSSVEGLVTHPDVETVQVTWSDNKVDQTAVNNNSYLFSRIGQFSYAKVEALDDQGKVIYTMEPAGAAPGK